MSIDFTILCSRSPAAFLKKKATWLAWDAKKESGAFGGMSLSLRSIEEHDPLPEPSFAERVVTVLHAGGRLSDDTYDDFDDWTRALAVATRGAIYSYPSGKFLYVWADVDEEQTELAEDRELQVIAANLEAARLDALARSLPLPADLGELDLLLDGVVGEDPLSVLRFDWFAGPQRDYMERRQGLLVALAASGRALPEPLVCRLAGLVYYVEALRSEEGRAELAQHGALGKAIGDAVHESQLRFERSERNRGDAVARARLENNALHGIKRDRPRTPDEVVALVRRGELAAAIVRYRELCPANAAQAEQAVEDARAYFTPS